VAEAALRTAYHFLSGKELPDRALNQCSLRGLKGVKECEADINGNRVRIAVVNGLGNLGPVLEKVRSARDGGKAAPYAMVEVMACPGGCIGGGGQPYGICDDIRKKRAHGLLRDDRKQTIRRSHQNPQIQKLYAEFLGKPLSPKAHLHLHTHYTPRPAYQK
jgi:NADH-quinone oxidoreductase subunit G